MGRPKGIQRDFRCKTWIYSAQVGFAFFFAFVGLTMGPAFLLGMEDAKGRPVPPVAGYTMTAFGAGALLYGVLAWLNRRARKAPVVALFREGVEFDRYSCSHFDGTEVASDSLSLVFAGLSGRLVKQGRYFRAAWSDLAGVRIGSLIPMNRSLIVEGRLVAADATSCQSICMPESYFQGRLEPVVEAIEHFAHDESARQSLPGWKGSGRLEAEVA